MSQEGTRVVVIGGGASGVLAAAALLRRPGVARVTVVGREERVGPGLAYGTAEPHHLLNSPAGRMGALADDEGGFVAWCAGRSDPIEAGAFAPRRRYGDYLAAVFDGLLATSGDRLEHVRGEAVAVEPGPRVRLADGRALDADRVVLALGNPPPAGRRPDEAPVVADPWAAGALDGLGRDVVLLGTGLTMVDAATRLARRDPEVRLTATSRALLLPRTHLSAPAAPGPGLAPRDGSLGAVLAAFGDRLRAARAEGRPWQAEVDGVRPQVNDLWAGFSPADRRRFVARVSRRWEVHRHRMAPAVAAELGALQRDGRLRLAPLPEVGPADAVVDCTGPRPFASRGWSPVVDRLLDDGVARADALGIGLDIAPDGALLDRSGRPSDALFLLGPGRRGTQWESTAVPEIRAHAAALAARLGA